MITNMYKITSFLLKNGFYEAGNENEDYCKTFGKKVEGINFIYRITISGRYIILNADPVVLFDRWSNCLFESYFDSYENFIENWYKYLENYNCDMDR